MICLEKLEEVIQMSRINKTQNNLQSVWNNLDLAYEHMERAIEDLSQMTGLPDELEKMVGQYDLSEISMIKQEVEELMDRLNEYNDKNLGKSIGTKMVIQNIVPDYRI